MTLWMVMRMMAICGGLGAGVIVRLEHGNLAFVCYLIGAVTSGVAAWRVSDVVGRRAVARQAPESDFVVIFLLTVPGLAAATVLGGFAAAWVYRVAGGPAGQ